VGRARRIHENLKEPFFKVLIGGHESLEQDVARPADQGMPFNQLEWVRGIKMKKTGWKGTHHKRPTYHVKSLHGRPCIRVQLTWCYVKRLKDAHRELVERKRHVQV